MRHALALVVLGACGGSAASFFDDPTQELPEKLSALGIEADGTVPAELLAYEAQWPLWSNGSTKDRHVFLPSAIDTSNDAQWDLPVGSMLFKTFSYGRPIETRVMRHLEDGWKYDDYLWDDAGTDATLLSLDEGVDVAVEIDGEAIVHRVPSRLDCRTCHQSSPQQVLGFASVQLDDATLATLDADGLRSDPQTPPRIEHPDPATRDVLGYFQGNCVHCHNGGTGSSASFDLRSTVALANIIDAPTESSASASGIRVEPGSPMTSILFLAVSGEGDVPNVKPMPPLGVQRRDAAAIEKLRAWITALPSS